jgi:hypothetical protein
LLGKAITAGDSAGCKQQLLALGVDRKACDRILAAWEAIADPGVPIKQRQAKMIELIGAIKDLRSPAPVKDELWRLQKSLTKHT